MLISEQIAKIIEELLSDGNGEAELQRNELADRIGCVPSQINYVITSRFTTDRGYIVESRRGGGGYIKIKKVEFDRINYVMHFLNAVNDSIDYQTSLAFITNLYGENLISAREAELMRSVLTERSLHDVPIQFRNAVRASILKNAVLGLLDSEN